MVPMARSTSRSMAVSWHGREFPQVSRCQLIAMVGDCTGYCMLMLGLGRSCMLDPGKEPATAEVGVEGRIFGVEQFL